MSLYKTSGPNPVEVSVEVFEGLLPQDTFFIHGNLASNHWWYPSLEFLRESAKGKNYSGRAFLAEFRGCGKSQAPSSENEVSMEIFADDFLSVLPQLTDRPVHLVGHSTGGLIAALMLAKSPRLFLKAILLDPVGAKGVKFDESMSVAFEQMKVDRDLLAMVLGSTIHENDPKLNFFSKVLVDDAFRAVNTVGLWVIRSLAKVDYSSKLSQIAHPVKVLHGEHDALLPVEDSRGLAALVKNGSFEMVAGQGHCCNIENPKLFAQLLLTNL